MEKQTILKKLVFLADNFYQGEKSVYMLLTESGYFQFHEDISEHNIYSTLLQYPQCIGRWFIFSGDKRTNGGYWLNQLNANYFEVGYGLKPLFFQDKHKACAAFIKRELEFIRLS
jgi:hypothetical protein